MKKFLALILAIAMVFSMIPQVSFAQDADYTFIDSEGNKYTLAVVLADEMLGDILADPALYKVVLDGQSFGFDKFLAKATELNGKSAKEQAIILGGGTPEPPVLEVIEITAISDKQILVNFNEKVTSALPENFKVVVGSEEKAIAKVELDPTTGKYAVLTVEGLAYETENVTVTVKDVPADRKDAEGNAVLLNAEKVINIPKMEDLFELKMTFLKSYKEDGVYNPLDKAVFDKLFIGEDATIPQSWMFGRIIETAQVRVAVVDKLGQTVPTAQGTVTLTPPTKGKLKVDLNRALVNGEALFILQAPEVSEDDFEVLSAKLSNTNIKLKDYTAKENIVYRYPGADGGSKIIKVVKAVARQADRVDVTFSENFSVDGIISSYASDYELNPVDSKPGFEANYAAIKARAQADNFGFDLNYVGLIIKDIVQKDARTITLILDTDALKGAKLDAYMRDGKTYVSPELYVSAKDKELELPFGTTTSNNILYEDSEHVLKINHEILSKNGTDNGITVMKDTTGVEFGLQDIDFPQNIDVSSEENVITVKFTEAIAERIAEEFEVITVGANTFYVSNNFKLNGLRILVPKTPGRPSAAERVYAADSANKVILADQLFVGRDLAQENAYLTSYEYGVPSTDERNYVTIVVDPKETKLENGKVYSFEVSNVGDWAGVVDRANVAATQKWDISLKLPEITAGFTVVQHSPEQFLISFDSPVEITDGKSAKDVFGVALPAGPMDMVAKGAPPLGKNEFQVRVVNGDDFTASPVNAISPTATSLPADAQYFLVEMYQDWTVHYDTNKNQVNYYTVKNTPITFDIGYLTNGFKNFEKGKNVKNITLTRDTKSVGLITKPLADVKAGDDVCADIWNIEPFLGKNGQVPTHEGEFFYIKTDEPVKLNTQAQPKGAFTPTEGLTPSQNELASASGDVNATTFEFDQNGKIVKGHLVVGSVDEDDMSFVIAPDEKLTVGKWDVIVKNLTDDVGNGTPTSIFEIEIKEAGPAPEGEFAIEWVAFDNDSYISSEPQHDYVYVKFTKPANSTGQINSVQNLALFALGGQVFDSDNASVKRGIEGVTSEWDGITITLKPDTWDGNLHNEDDFARNFSVEKTLESVKGERLTAPYQVNLADTATELTGCEDADMNFEAFYGNPNQGIYGTPITGGYLAKDTNNDGKIDKIEADVGTTGVANTSIFVGGIEFFWNGSDAYEPDPAEVANLPVNTDSNSLGIQGGYHYDGSYVPKNRDSKVVFVAKVTDMAKPVLVSATLSDDKKSITVVTSEKVNQVAPLAVGDFTLSSGTATLSTVELVDGEDTIVFEVTNGDQIASGDTITIADGKIKDLVSNENASTPAVKVANAKVATGVQAKATNTPYAPKGADTPAKADTWEATFTTSGIITDEIVTIFGKNINIVATGTPDTAATIATKVYTALDDGAGNHTLTVGATVYNVTDDVAGKLTFTAQNAGALVAPNVLATANFAVAGANASGVSIAGSNTTPGADLVPGTPMVKESERVDISVGTIAAGRARIAVNATDNAMTEVAVIVDITADDTAATIAQKFYNAFKARESEILGWTVEYNTGDAFFTFVGIAEKDITPNLTFTPALGSATDISY